MSVVAPCPQTHGAVSSEVRPRGFLCEPRPELGETKSLVISTNLFDLFMQNNISTNGSPTPEDGEHGASTIGAAMEGRVPC